ncbi:MDR family MFS transporter [Rhizobium leguminosarum]|uniref:DHA2 family efflux MFS transporter permease subunit n=1 Tax=Rhizobium leguminosarum TaxID=384 RepID=A0ABD7PPE6_RHILE|nr:MDR family MFS transporter [Rhizobium leguminosarum]TAV72880.1 DHA2 family efflux MFS transporter permease subunit [Rhizobium leguminosarum]TAV77481.1 DHA2 family efflux MFS transporter permease subunit [Rhizobium leguminosarum]TAW28860.1 DHA2 family efflux MFS transporter permease subunit [Rhizobium leguminosarum]TAW42587.1 DHA2 family efflux MFS transporter permease subunit [Rhizobium leguminosarum]TAZ29227.1 DHA2 family efflux MFS transporter permease subunit [Rhizobium leguminosarum]
MATLQIAANGNSLARPAAAAPVAPAVMSPLRMWTAVVGSTLGAFMAVLNIQIVNASLADIQGAIGAGTDDGGWISTSYLIAEIVVIPLSAWLARVFSLRNYLLTNAILFLIFSVACAFAANLQQMIILRAIQGFSGGVLIPMAFTIIITLLPKAKQPIGLALFALSATFAPAIGPTIGGYLTENWGWEYIFYVNLVPGALMVGMLWASLDRGPMNLKLLAKGDWPGIVTMAIGLAALQTVLEEGNKEDWFGSDFIVRLSVIAAVSLTLFLIIELKTANPLLNLRLLVRRNFGFGIVANFLLGIALYGSVFVLPIYLTRIQGYNSEQIGMVLAWTGIPQLLLIPLVPQLMKRFDVRLLIVVGFALFAASNFMNVHMTGDYATDQLFWPNIVRAIGQALVFTPLSAIATAGIEQENAGSASALFNMMRNLGGAVGIASLQTFLSKREQFHSNILTNSVSVFEEATRDRIAKLTGYFMSHGVSDQALASHKAVVAIALKIRRQANIMAFSDTFFLLGVALVVALLASLLLKKPGQLSGGGAH